MNTSSSSSSNASPVNGHAAKILDDCSSDLFSTAASQKSLVTDLFTAIRYRKVADVIRLAPLVDDLDSHLDNNYNERPLMLAARHDLPVAALRPLLARSNARLTNADGATPLMLAAWGALPYSADLARLLLPVSDPLALCGKNSALRYAIRAYCSDQHSTDTISLLLPVSDLAQKDMEGLDPLAQARRADLDQVAKLILGEMARRDAEAIARCADIAPPLNSRAPRL